MYELQLAFIFIWALPAVRELYQYINDPRYVIVISVHRYALDTYPKEGGEDGAARLVTPRYGRNRAARHHQVEPGSIP